MKRSIAAALLASAALLLGAGVAPAQDYVPGTQDAFNPLETPVESPAQRLRGFPVTAGQAVQAAEQLTEVKGERARQPGLTRRVLIPSYLNPPDRWIIVYENRGKAVLQVEIHARTGRAVALWTGHQIGWFMARGTEGQFGRTANAPYVWLPLCLLFLLPFLDPGRPFRLLHLDLLALIGFSASLFYFNEGEIGVSVPLAYPPLVYLLIRMLVIGFRNRADAGPLVPFASARLLLAGAVLVTAFKVGLDVVDGRVIDVGLAGVRGADRISDGLELYQFNEYTADVYGPLNYLIYIPFLAVFPWSGVWDGLAAARAAAITFDLLTLLGVFVLGTRLRPGPQGKALGAALAYGWATFPFTTYVLQANSNDSFVAAFVVWSLVALRSPAARGALTGLGTMVKFAPFALVPLLAAGEGDRRLRQLAVFAAALIAACALPLIPFIPDGGLREFYDTTIGFQAGRESPFSLWGLEPSLDWLHTTITLAAGGLCALVFFVPRRREPRQICALAAAVLIAVQLPAMHWFYLYLVWFLPPLLAALFAGHLAPPLRGKPRKLLSRPAVAPA